MSTHIDTLAKWWESAEEGVINEGDRLIYRNEDDYDFRIAKRKDAGQGAEKGHERGWGILHRAPKPKPAWHDAVAVIAHTEDGHVRQVWERDGDTDCWVGTEGYVVHSDALANVTPLIEQKVTDEMVLRGGGASYTPPDTMRRILTAALGIDPA